MVVDTVITGGTVVSHADTFEASVAIDDGEIAGVGRESALPDGTRTVDATGKLVMPGVVDPHTHIDEVPENRAGSYRTETRAAALGGVTTLIDFAFQGGDRALSDESAGLLDGIEHKRAKERESVVDFSLHGVLHREDADIEAEIEDAIEAGVTSFKMFMSTYEIGVSTGFLLRAFERIADAGAVAAVHTENPSVCDARITDLKRAGKGDASYYPRSRPDFAEAMAAEDAVRLATATGVNYYGVHTTCRDSAEVIDGFQEEADNIRAETCTHYTAHDEGVYEEHGNLAKIAPPIRTADDVEAMFEYLEKGTLSVVSTDHAVYHREYKDVENWWDSPFGANSLQVSLPVFHTEAVVERDFSYPFLVRKMCRNPARTFGLARKGTLEPGTDADVVVFDPDERFTVSAADNASNAGYSIYEGREVAGRVEKTFVRGRPVVDGGEIVAEPGHGRFVERDLPDWR